MVASQFKSSTADLKLETRTDADGKPRLHGPLVSWLSSDAVIASSRPGSVCSLMSQEWLLPRSEMKIEVTRLA